MEAMSLAQLVHRRLVQRYPLLPQPIALSSKVVAGSTQRTHGRTESEPGAKQDRRRRKKVNTKKKTKKMLHGRGGVITQRNKKLTTKNAWILWIENHGGKEQHIDLSEGRMNGRKAKPGATSRSSRSKLFLENRKVTDQKHCHKIVPLSIGV